MVPTFAQVTVLLSGLELFQAFDAFDEGNGPVNFCALIHVQHINNVPAAYGLCQNISTPLMIHYWHLLISKLSYKSIRGDYPEMLHFCMKSYVAETLDIVQLFYCKCAMRLQIRFVGIMLWSRNTLFKVCCVCVIKVKSAEIHLEVHKSVARAGINRQTHYIWEAYSSLYSCDERMYGCDV